MPYTKGYNPKMVLGQGWGVIFALDRQPSEEKDG